MTYGERCRGSQQHCYYPAYRNPVYETERNVGLLAECKDKSDQIFERKSQCNMRAHLDIYCDHCRDIRSNLVWKYFGDCETKCEDRDKFIAEQTNRTINSEYYDEYPNKYWKSEQEKNDVLDPDKPSLGSNTLKWEVS